MRNAVAGVAGAVVLTLAVTGCGKGGAPSIAANVEGTEITSAQVQALYDIFAQTDTGAADLQGADGVKVDPREVRATALSYQIKVAFIEYLARREGVAVPAGDSQDSLYDELAQIGSLKVSGYQGQDLKTAARLEAISKAIAKKLLPDATVTRAELQQAYDERKDLVGKSFRATTGVAFMDSPESAAALKQELAKGTDFTAATDALSGTVAAQVVDINPISPIQPELIETVRKLDPGQSSDPVRYDLGEVTVYTVLYQQKRTDLPALTLEQAKPELTKIVVEHKQFLVFSDWLKKQYTDAKITVDKYYGEWNPTYQAVV
ncbi:MAG TPA: peptidylprolyl isomerase [Sporichthya sp.]|nr:peptidylprolyl isomerase [Sporichthya sp.]